MAITAMLNTAVSALNANLTALRTTSNNIANVNTPGYARQSVELISQVIDGDGAGVQVSQIKRVVDSFLSAELRLTMARAESFDVQSATHDRIQSLLGEPGQGNTLAALLSGAFDSIANLSTEPESAARRTTATADLRAFGDAISRLAAQIQSLRVNADRQLANDIDTANTTLSRIHDLNQLIVSESLSGRTAHGLEDQRDQAIDALSEIFDIRVTELSNGSVNIGTASGLTLLDVAPRKLVYSAPGTVTTATRFPEITVNAVDPVTKVVGATGIPLYTGLSDGRLHGYIQLRDVQLPDFAVQLGELASKVVAELNAAHNDNTAVPPPKTLSGRNTGLTGADAHGFTGRVTLAVINAANGIKSSFVVDFSAYTTITDVLNAVNTNLAGDATLTLSNGALTFDAVSGSEGVSILQDPASPSNRAGRGFAHFFGLNDLMEAKVQINYQSGFSGTDNHLFTGTANFELRGPGGQIAAIHTVDFGTIGADFDALVSDLNNNFLNFATFALDANGRLTMTPAPAYSDFELVTVSDGSNRSSTGVTVSRLLGLGDRLRADAAFDVKVKSAIRANTNLLALAKLDTAAAAGMPALTVGDGRGALDMQDVSKSLVQFSAAGDLADTTTTLGDFAGLVLAQISVKGRNIDDLAADAGALKSALMQRVSEVSGVNIDEELTNMIAFQNAFAASARILATAEEMFDLLTSLLR